jgi:4-amino-4-deoxy-L-arabinose transferase-like glycosyltransferase
MRRKTWVRLGVWLAFFLFYALTTARDVLPADSGEFQVVAAGWGIAHPPGYPLYTVVGALWVRLIPFGTVPFRLNLLSAVLAATALLLVLEAVRTWVRAWDGEARAAWLGGWGAALLLGAAATFWAQATTANIRMPTALFTAWGFLALAHYRRAATERGRDRALLSLALATGLGVGHHPSLVFTAVGWGAYLLLLDASLLRQPRRWWRPVLVAALAWALPQLYLPIRGGMTDVPLAPDGLNTWRGFWFHVLAQGFSGDMFAFATAQDLALRLPLLGTLFGLQFPGWTVALALGGWLWLLRRHPRLGVSLGLSWVVHTFVTITYRAPQTVEYLMPAYLPVALAFGLALAAVARYARRRATWVLRGAVLLVVLTLAARVPLTFPDFFVLANDRSVRERVAPLLETASSEATVLADWRWATPLWVLQRTEALGPDVAVDYVAPVAGQTYEQVWQDKVKAAATIGPVYTTHAYDWPDWTRAPVGGGYRYDARPLTALPPDLGFHELSETLGPVRLLGYRVVGAARPGGAVEVQIAWQAVGAQTPAPSLTVRLYTPDGLFLGNVDRFLGSDAQPGEIRFSTVMLRLPLAICPGAVRPAIGVYTVEDGAFNNHGELPLADVPVTCDFPALPVERARSAIVLGTGPFLRGVDYDVRGDAATAYLHLCGPGRSVRVQSGDVAVYVDRLAPGVCRTVDLPVPVGSAPPLVFTRADGRPARLLSLPLPAPQPGDRYVPFGDEMVLVDVDDARRGGRYVVDLRWRSVRPLVDDYAVSVRLQGADGAQLGVHDIQPALSTLPTLKWVVSGAAVLDPHPFAPLEAAPARYSVVVYERFRLHNLPPPTGTPAERALGE